MSWLSLAGLHLSPVIAYIMGVFAEVCIKKAKELLVA